MTDWNTTTASRPSAFVAFSVLYLGSVDQSCSAVVSLGLSGL